MWRDMDKDDKNGRNPSRSKAGQPHADTPAPVVAFIPDQPEGTTLGGPCPSEGANPYKLTPRAQCE